MMHLFLVGMLLSTRGWDSEGEPYYTIKKSLTVFWGSCGSDQAVCLEELLMADVFWGCEGEWPRRDGPSCFFIVTHA